MISRGACLFAFDIDWIVGKVCARADYVTDTVTNSRSDK